MEKKRMTKTTLFLACVVTMILVTSMASAAPFQNGDFETFTNYNGGAWGSVYAPTGITGWTAFGRNNQGNPYGLNDASYASYTMYGATPPNYHSIMLRWVYAGGLWQTFDTVVGHQYQVDWVVAGELTGTTPIRNYRVNAGPISENYTFDTTGKSTTNMGWTPMSLNFIAESTASTLKFENTGVEEWCGNAAIIDNVSVTDLGVPPPIIANGSFENVSSGTGPNYGSSENPNGITGWTAGRTEGGGTDSPSGVTRYDVGAEGTHSVCLSWKYGGSIRQTMNTVAGKRYRIDFKLAGDLSYEQVYHLDVMTSGTFAPGTETHFTFDSTGKTWGNMGWVSKSVFIDATSSSTTIIFSSDDANSINNYSGPIIDDLVGTDLGSTLPSVALQNGSFEDINNWNGGHWCTDSVPNGVTGWTAFGVNGQGSPYGIRDADWTAYTLPDGIRAMMMRYVYAGGIEQTMNTIEGHQYQVNFLMGGEFSGSTPVRNLKLTAGPTNDKFRFDTTGHTAHNMGWETKSLPFVADSHQSLLQFLNTGLVEWAANAAIIDSVSVTDLGVASPLIANGSFETIADGTGPQYGSTATPNGIIAWTAAKAEGGGTGTPAGVTRMNVAAAGDYSVCLSWLYGGSIRQTFNTVAGKRYRIDFKLAGNPDYAQINHLDVIANGSTSQFTFDSTGKSLTDMGWVKQSVMLDATSSTSTITFSSTDANYSGPVIDDVVATEIGLAPAQTKTIGDAKTSPDGVSVQVSGIVTGLCWGGDFYLETPDRVSGIRINQASYAFAPGNNVILIGEMSTRPSGERQIVLNDLVQNTGGAPLLPLGMTNKSIGGGTSGNPPDGQAGVTGGFGLNNIGLLVRTTGVVYNTDYFTTFYLDDGSGVTLKVIDDFNTVIPNDGDYISVTGMISCEKVGSDILPVLLVTAY